MKLNLGSGDLRMDGYTNVDLRSEVADIVCDAADLSFAGDGSVEEVVALDLLEHIPAARTQAVLAEWRRVLVDGGTLIVKVPNLRAICEQIVVFATSDDRPQRVQLLIRNLYGGHRWGPDGAWDAHATGWTPSLLAAELGAAGFEVIDNDLALNMRVTAKKAAS